MIRRWLPILAIVVSTCSLCLAIGLFVNARNARDDICLSRNEERAVHRQSLTEQLQQTKQLPEALFQQFEIPKSQALIAIRKRRARLAPLACDALTWTIQPSKTRATLPYPLYGSRYALHTRR
jgi:hypothetical protein